MYVVVAQSIIVSRKKDPEMHGIPLSKLLLIQICQISNFLYTIPLI